MKNKARYILSTLTALCITNAVPCLAAVPEPSLIYVTGYAEREVVPDMAYIILGMETTSSQLEEAKAANTAAMNSFQKELLVLGLAKENLQTIDYRVYPRKDKNGEKLIGYTVTNRLKVKVNNLQLLSKIFQKASTCGINSIDDIEFTCFDTTSMKAELVKAAVANGRRIAETAAAGAGAQLGSIKEIHVNGVFSGPTANRMQNLKLAKSTAIDYSPEMEQGTKKISETVNLVFYIKE